MCPSLETTHTKYFYTFPHLLCNSTSGVNSLQHKKNQCSMTRRVKLQSRLESTQIAFKQGCTKDSLINLSAAHSFKLQLHLLNNDSSFKQNFLLTPTLQNITFHPSMKTGLFDSRMNPFTGETGVHCSV